ncbi:MAG: hypothetical protein ACAI44_17540 [Candidatus Sericytochromatia bacterium]
MKYLLACLLSLVLAAAAAAQPVAWQTRPEAGIPRLGGPLPVQGIPINSNRLDGLSRSWVESQYQLYAQTIVALNRVLRRNPQKPADRSLALQLFNRQALYFGFLENLGGSGPPNQGPILRMLQQEGLDWEAWQAQVLELAEYLKGGSGWIIWEYNLLSHSTGLYPAQDETDLRLGSIPLLVLNLNRSAYQPVSGEDVAEYTRRLLANLRWSSVAARLAILGIL